MPERSHAESPLQEWAEAPVAAILSRGAVTEAVFRAALAEADASGRVLNALGSADLVTTMRSAAKPLQAAALIGHPRYREAGVREEELAICCASHIGAPLHAALAASLLALSGFLPDDLVCRPAGEPPSPLKNGCSGNHAGILLLARLLGAPLGRYWRADHPTQQAILTTVRRLTGETPLITADACGVPTFGVRLAAMARAFALLTLEEDVAPIGRAMNAHPELIGHPDGIDVRLMQAFPGRFVAKTGAEGLLCIGLIGEGRGFALKMVDGSARALGAVAVAALQDVGWITESEALTPLLADLREPRFSSDGDQEGAVIRAASASRDRQKES